MAFVKSLPTNGGGRPDSTQDKWNNEFVRTVNNKTTSVFNLERYKDFVINGDRWGHGVINYVRTFKPNWFPVAVTNVNQKGDNIDYNISLIDNASYGNKKFYVISFNGNARLMTSSPYINKPDRDKRIEEYVHIFNAGGHSSNINQFPVFITREEDYRTAYAGYYHVQYFYIDNEYINTLTDLENGKIRFEGFNSATRTRYIFSNGEEGYVDESYYHTIEIPPSLREDPNAWIKFIKNAESESLNYNNIYMRESQKVPFNRIKRVTGSYNFGYTTNNDPIHKVRNGTFNISNDWYIIALQGSRSGNSVTLRIRYIGSNGIDRVVVRNNNTSYGGAGRNNDGWAQVTVNCPDKGLVLDIYSGGRRVEAAIHVD